MASITIRQLPEATKRKLRMRAAQNGRSMEQEAREILKCELSKASKTASRTLAAMRSARLLPSGEWNSKSPRASPFQSQEFDERPMIILDTNVISELMSPSPSESELREWLSARSVPSAIHRPLSTWRKFFMALNFFREANGAMRLCPGCGSHFAEDFVARHSFVLMKPAARAFATIAASRRSTGSSDIRFDAQIAAIAPVQPAPRLPPATRLILRVAACSW